ncbi:MAG: histidine kinase N-terminal 7TM domain-containing protein [Candidatus Paceibacterota bacterium]
MILAAQLALISGILNLGLALILFFNKNPKRENKIYAISCFVASQWLFTTVVMFGSTTDSDILFWDRLANIAVLFIPVLMFHFSLVFSGQDDKKSLFLWIGYIVAVCYIYLTQTDKFYNGVFTYEWGKHARAQFYHDIWFIVFIFYTILFFFNIIRIFLKSSGSQKNQARIILIGFAVYAVAGLAILPAYNIGLFPISYLAIPISTIIVIYAILRYRFMDISFVVGRGFIYASTYLTIIGSAFLLVFGHNYLGYSIPATYLWSALLALGVIFYQPLFAFYERIAEKYFYYTYHSYQKALSDLGRKANRFLELDKLSTLLLDTICEIMHLDKAAIAIKNEKGGVAIIQSRGFERSKLQYFLKGDFLEIYLGECLKPVSAEDIPELATKAVNNDYEKRRFHDLGQEMKKAAVNLCLPLAVENKLSGVILLGNKNISDQFSEQDVALLGALAMHASIALQNAQYYSRIKSFGARLENSVRQKTNELEEANERLKQLDKAKSEFVSIASHQLRAPLTIIKGYLAVIKDGDYGKAPADAQARLATAYKANEQLISFTNDLLDMSRLESGKTVLKSEEIDLGVIVASVVLQLTPEAQKTGVALSFEKPSAKIIAKGDRQACEQAIYNVIANSMAHTPRGKIFVKLETAKNLHRVLVRDNGEGFSHEDLKNIFNKQPPTNSEGVGLSLVSGIAMYLAKKMVEMQKGKIKVDSQGLGQGAEYLIEMPNA